MIAAEKYLDSLQGVELQWSMISSERLALQKLLELVRPEVSIEIGTASGGSLQMIARYSRRVYSIDIDAAGHEKLRGRFANVELLTGDSAVVLPELLGRLAAEKARLGFVLIDGSHWEVCVRKDVQSLLAYKPEAPLHILMHDSFNPEVREGILTAGLEQNPHVHLVELDFAPGCAITHNPGHFKEMWGGFALAVMRPEKREGPLEIGRTLEFMYVSMLQMSAYNRSVYAERLLQRMT
jgi:hypothetical protein